MGAKNTDKQNGEQVPALDHPQDQRETKGEGGDQEKKSEEVKKNAPNSKAEAVLLGTYIHCEGCEVDVKKSLKFFEGVEEIEVDKKNHKVTVKGKNLDPWKVLERLEKKTQKHVELISPKVPRDAKKKVEVKGNTEATNKKEPQVIIAILKVYIHCESCAHEVKKCAQKMKGVLSVEVDPKKSLMTVKGTFDPPKLVHFIHKRGGKHVEIIKQEKVDGKDKDKGDGKDNDKGDGKSGEKKNEEGENKKGRGEPLFYYYPPQIVMEKTYPPLFFNDEDVNSCSIT
ncbi:heavy metal-associated isoprenylated plant protein 8-like [Malania oleifera]|uniref:heavy metal-associated isoprenylated plant protein 8-like n=1 Tax=Malania oleifera TaxID=397392 RepID=UPI0025AE370C|nr:heavy metal-associated isoprenylated plant protein 8-like [Malania oleifera]